MIAAVLSMPCSAAPQPRVAGHEYGDPPRARHDSLSSSNSFTMSSGTESVEPVTLPPGRARLATNRYATASPLPAKTIGIVVVACLAARIAGVPPVTRTSTLRPRQFGGQVR